MDLPTQRKDGGRLWYIQDTIIIWLEISRGLSFTLFSDRHLKFNSSTVPAILWDTFLYFHVFL